MLLVTSLKRRRMPGGFRGYLPSTVILTAILQCCRWTRNHLECHLDRRVELFHSHPLPVLHSGPRYVVLSLGPATVRSDLRPCAREGWQHRHDCDRCSRPNSRTSESLNRSVSCSSSSYHRVPVSPSSLLPDSSSQSLVMASSRCRGGSVRLMQTSNLATRSPSCSCLELSCCAPSYQVRWRSHP